MDDFYRVILQEGLLHAPGKPLGWGDDGEIFDAPEPLLLSLPHEPGPVNEGSGVNMGLGTVMTAGFPFLTLYHGKVRTLPGHGPAIVQCPYGGNPALLQEAEEKGEIDITVMQIVQMNHIRLPFPDILQKTQRRKEGEAAVQPGHLCQCHMHISRKPIADEQIAPSLFLCVAAALRVTEQYLVAPLLRRLGNLKHDISRTAVITGVDI